MGVFFYAFLSMGTHHLPTLTQRRKMMFCAKISLPNVGGTAVLATRISSFHQPWQLRRIQLSLGKVREVERTHVWDISKIYKSQEKRKESKSLEEQHPIHIAQDHLSSQKKMIGTIIRMRNFCVIRGRKNSMEVTELLQHCPWSPSYLKQILDCTMSLPKDGLAVDDSGEAAERGTLQHTYLIKDRLAKYFHKESVDMDTSVFTDDELDEVERAYQEVIGEYLYMRRKYARVEVILEERVELNNHLPSPCWGYVDIAFIGHRAKPNKDGVYDKSMIYVLDAKFGRVEVSVICPEHKTKKGLSINPQICAYWWGIYDIYSEKYEITRGAAGIIQPKLNRYPVGLFKADDFLTYMKEVIYPKVQLAVDGKGSYNPSVKNCQHCRNKIHCKHNIAQILVLKELMDKPDMVDDATIEDLILPFVIDLKKLCDATFNYCLTRAKEGKKWKGFALSTTRPTRVYSDEDKAKEIALKHGYKGFVVEEILSPAQAEKLMGKNTFKQILGSLITYKQGKTTLVPEDEVKGNEAKNDFNS